MAHETFVLCDAVDADGNRCPTRALVDRRCGASMPAGWSTVSTAYVEQQPTYLGCGGGFGLKQMLEIPAFQKIIEVARAKGDDTAQLIDALLEGADAASPPQLEAPTPMVFSRTAIVCDKHPLPKVLTGDRDPDLACGSIVMPAPAI